MDMSRLCDSGRPSNFTMLHPAVGAMRNNTWDCHKLPFIIALYCRCTDERN